MIASEEDRTVLYPKKKEKKRKKRERERERKEGKGRIKSNLFLVISPGRTKP